MGGVLSPTWAAEDDGGAGSPVVGGFSMGDGLEGTISERDGAFSLAFPVGGLSLGWASGGIGVDRFGFGSGWGWRLGHVDPQGGVRVFPASGGVYEVDGSHRS